jgi:hypothetical protein
MASSASGERRASAAPARHRSPVGGTDRAYLAAAFSR